MFLPGGFIRGYEEISRIIGARGVIAVGANGGNDSVPGGNAAVQRSSRNQRSTHAGAATSGSTWFAMRKDSVISASTDFNVTLSVPGRDPVHRTPHPQRAGGRKRPCHDRFRNRGAEPVVSSNGPRRASICRAKRIPTNAAGLDTVNGMLTDPSGYYVNLHTTENPGGVIRGQLQRAEMVVLMG